MSSKLNTFQRQGLTAHQLLGLTPLFDTKYPFPRRNLCAVIMPDNDVTEYFDGVGDVIIRKIVE